ncbi:TIGR03084 family metal-binding protein [Nocardioides zeae]|uniref:TIGR03084 family metal-binding protein n=1 Tax=Nocardioides imazamoxiresistens TaxID=3231893 RepID=A0ABU3PUI9_9ACTN|nr:TIGR03084 family metal-binding protein [Nocardioides zeae]MDT9592871.1 TIGR03084 family metal-binding protein [Nocardioides zeae]
MNDPRPTPGSALDAVLADLVVLTERLDTLVAARPEADWRRATPAEGWDVATQVAHLWWTDVAATAAANAATDKAEWDAIVLTVLEDPDGAVDTSALAGGAVPPTELLATWRAGRTALVDALLAHAAEHPGEKLPWFGPPMSPTSMASARYMETWAHGLDVHDALDVVPEHDDGVRHVCHIGFRTRDFAHRNRGLEPPTAPFHVKLTAPSGEVWTYGPDDAEQRVEGPAVDFAQLVTQRRHRDDLALTAHGAEVDRWLDLAQAFAGPPGGGRAPAAHRPEGGDA